MGDGFVPHFRQITRNLFVSVKQVGGFPMIYEELEQSWSTQHGHFCAIQFCDPLSQQLQSTSAKSPIKIQRVRLREI
jgi:hypothetical protein